MHVDPQNVDVRGLIDMHIHTGPDVRPRLLDDIDAARQAAQAGIRAVVFKSHVTCTADRATIAGKVVPGVRVFGGVTLNAALGGLNPAAVEAALRLGARIVWMPTISAQNHIRKHGGASQGIGVLGEDGALRPSLFDVFELVKQHDAILATGHLSVEEIMALASGARAAGVRKVVVTHPEMPWIDMPVDVQKRLRDLGVYFERCYVSLLPEIGNVPLARIVSDIRLVGVSSTVLATDCGADGLPAPVAGLRAFVAALLAEGFSHRDIQLMTGETPAELLGIDWR
jgi:hypothetical protein